MRMFQFKQSLFYVEASGIAGKCSVAANDPVAGNNNADFVFVVGHADGAAAFRAIDLFGNLFVRAYLAVGNRQ